MNTAIIWFRKILRIHDNPILTWASRSEGIDSILPIFIMNDEWVNDKNRSMGPNRIKFQLESMIDLNNRLGEKYDSELLIFKGNNIEIVNVSEIPLARIKKKSL